MTSNTPPIALGVFLDKAGIDPEADISMEQFDEAALRLAQCSDMFDYKPPFLFLTIEQHRDTLVEDLRTAMIPEPTVKTIVGKMTLFVAQKLRRSFAFWDFQDGSGILRFESANWQNLSPIYERLIKEIISEGSDAQFAAKIAEELGPSVQAAKRTPRLFPLAPQGMKEALRTMCIPGPIALDGQTWRKGFQTRRFPDAPITPAQIVAICVQAGYDLSITKEEMERFLEIKEILTRQ